MYEGDGHWLADQSFREHRDFERFKQKEEENSHHLPSMFVFNNHSTKLQTITDELDWLATLPVICPSKALLFRPQKNGTVAATLDGYARANRLFFEVQSRLHFLSTAVQDMPPCDDRDEVAGRIQDALQDLDALKWRQWHTRGGTINLTRRDCDGGTIAKAVAIDTGEYMVEKFQCKCLILQFFIRDTLSLTRSYNCCG